MKISAETITILKNFATINQSILIREGNQLATMDGAPSVRAMVVVPETFPHQIAIYDLHQFLGILAMMGDCEVDFQERKAVISAGKQRVDFIYSSPNLIKAASTKRPKGGDFFTGQLTVRDISTIMKASAVFTAPALSFVGENGKATLYIGTPKTDAFEGMSNSFQMELGETDKDFDLRVPVELFKVIPDTYTFALNSNKFIYLKSTTGSLEYWVAGNPDSVV